MNLMNLINLTLMLGAVLSATAIGATGANRISAEGHANRL
jgi:hypothetical protein